MNYTLQELREIEESRTYTPEEIREIENILGQSLGYPTFQGDICVGDHSLVSLAKEAAEIIYRYKDLEK